MAEPESGTRSAFEDREFLLADLTAHKPAPIATRGAGQVGLAASIEFGAEPRAAVMAEAGPIATRPRGNAGRQCSGRVRGA